MDINSTRSGKLRRRAARKIRRAKPVLERVFRKIGLAVYKYREEYHYCPSIYGYGYWKKIDIKELADFGELAGEVISHGRTFLQHDRLYVIYQAILNVRHLSASPLSMAEVGVYRGGSTYFIASVAKKLFKDNPAIHAFDTFEGFQDDLDPVLDDGHWPGKFGNTSFSEVEQYLSVFPNVKLRKGRFQDRCEEVSGERFSFVHIDVDIFLATHACLDFFSDALVPGGIVVVDDYGFARGRGAKEAVDGFMGGRTNFVKFHLDTGQCLLIRMM